MSVGFGTWQDRDYDKIPRENFWSRVNWHVQHLIETKYPNPTKCPATEANLFHHQAVEMVKREDDKHPQLFKKESAILSAGESLT